MDSFNECITCFLQVKLFIVSGCQLRESLAKYSMMVNTRLDAHRQQIDCPVEVFGQVLTDTADGRRDNVLGIDTMPVVSFL